MHKLARIFGASAMAVKQVDVNEAEECQMKIMARKAGLIAWLLSLIGVDSSFTLYVYRDRIGSLESSLSGRLMTIIPLKALDTYRCGFTKPFIWLLLALGAGVGAFVLLLKNNNDTYTLLGIILLLFSVWKFFEYVLGKCLILEFTTNGGHGISFLCKRSIIEGVKVDGEMAACIGRIVRNNLREQLQK